MYRHTIKIGVLGGIGPEATGRFYDGLFRRLQQRGIEGNTSYPQVIVNSIPAPELVGKISDDQIIPYRIGLKELDDLGVDFIAMVCNTIHLYRDELQKGIRASIIDLREEVRRKLATENIKKITVLGTGPTIEQGLYAFPEMENVPISHEDIQKLEMIIINYNSGKDKKNTKYQIADVVGIAVKYINEGAQVALLGCTEIAVMLKDVHIPKIDTLDVLIDATIEHDRLEKNHRAEIQYLFENACGPDE